MLVACSAREVFWEVLVYLCAVLYRVDLCLNLYLYLRCYSAARVWFREGLWEVVESEAGGHRFPRLSENIHSNLQIVTTQWLVGVENVMLLIIL